VYSSLPSVVVWGVLMLDQLTLTATPHAGLFFHWIDIGTSQG
jgi:hypothetical protein